MQYIDVPPLVFAAYRFQLRFESPVAFSDYPELEVRHLLTKALHRTDPEWHHRLFGSHQASRIVLDVQRKGTRLWKTQWLQVNFTLIEEATDAFFPLLNALNHAGFHGYPVDQETNTLFMVVSVHRILPDRWEPVLTSNQPEFRKDPIPPTSLVEWNEQQHVSEEKVQLFLHWITPFVVKWKNPEDCFQLPFLLWRLSRRLQQLLPSHLELLTFSENFSRERLDSIQSHVQRCYIRKLHVPTEHSEGDTFFYGLSGSVLLEGQLSFVWPWLRAGSLLHLGKDTGFGMGKYVIRILNSSLENKEV